MQKAPWIAAAALAALLVPLGVDGQATGVEYTLFIACPETDGLTLAPNERSGCPVRAIDPSQQQAMGEPTLAVDPSDPKSLIIASLHGAPSGGQETFNCGQTGPTVRSRCNLPFTTFTSSDGGAIWWDNYFSAPEEVDGAFGEHPALTIDPYGRLYVGSLYASPLDNGGFDYTISAQTFPTLQSINENQDGAYNAEYLKPVYPGNAIGQLWFLFNPATDNMTMLWHEQVTPQSGSWDPSTIACKAGPASRPSNSTGSPTNTSSNASSSTSTNSSGSSSTTASASSSSSGPLARLPYAAAPTRLVPLGRDAQAEPAANRTARSVLGIVWTAGGGEPCYHYQPPDWAIGPCQGSTNPVLSEGWLYVGCVSRTDEGEFPWHPDTIPGTVEMFRLRPDGGRPQYLGPSNIVGGLPKLGVRSDGRLVLATAFADDGVLRLEMAFGQYDPGTKRIDWSSHLSLGSKAATANQAGHLMGANVQDLVYREHSGVAHVILKERLEPGLGVTSAAAALGSQQRKHILAIDETYGLLAKLPLDVGNPINRSSNPILRQTPEDVFDDLSDDFLQYPQVDEFRITDPNGREHLLQNYQREFFAVGDYGEVIFAELVEVTNLRGPAFPFPSTPIQPQPAPAASTTSSATLVPAAGLTLIGALTLALLASKRELPSASRHRLGKRRGRP